MAAVGSPARRTLAVAVLVAVTYAGAGWLGLRMPYVGSSVTLIWPPTGIAFAALWRFGPAAAIPGVMLGALVVNLLTADSLPFSLMVAVGNAGPAVLGVWLLRRWRVEDPFRSPSSIHRFILAAVLLGPMVSASAGTLSLWLTGLLEASRLPLTWLVWWAGDAMGVLVVAPMLLTLGQWRQGPWSSGAGRAELIGALGGLMVLWVLLFAGVLGADQTPLSYLAVPLIIYAAVRFDLAVTSALMLTLAVLAVVATALGQGPFARDTFHASFAHLHAFLSVVALVGLFLGGAIAQYRRALAELRQALDRATEANGELERFAYVASHDLQEPLRTITAFTQLLDRRYRPQLDAQAGEYIDFVVGAAHRMHDLINDLLSYSRLKSGGGELVTTSAQACCAAALENLRESIVEAGASIGIGTLPPVTGDPSQLTQLFQNLLSNAIKFRRPGGSPRIVVAAVPGDPGRWVFSVSDDGIGIEESDQDVFEIFRRQHGAGRYAGTGIGLAVCKRIVERHGGRIWYISRPGEGCTMMFTLAAAHTTQEPALQAC